MDRRRDADVVESLVNAMGDSRFWWSDVSAGYQANWEGRTASPG